MLVRPDGDAVLLISQNAHAWVSGQIARAWKTDDDHAFEPYEEVCLAAELHDIGWQTWEGNPTLNPETGVPYTFRELPRREYLQVWTRARRFSTIINRYAALLISRHGTRLLARYGPAEDAPRAEKEQIEGFLRREAAAQGRLIESLAESPRYEPFVSDEVLDRNSGLISTWDGMSLMLCGGLPDDGITIGDYTMTPDEDGTVRVDPWPFTREQVQLVVEGRRLTGRYERQITLQSALQKAEWQTLQFDLVTAE